MSTKHGAHKHERLESVNKARSTQTRRGCQQSTEHTNTERLSQSTEHTNTDRVSTKHGAHKHGETVSTKQRLTFDELDDLNVIFVGD